MFKSTLIRPNESRDYPLDVGQIAENLLFYGTTNIHVGRNDLQKLVEYIDADSLIELIKSHGLNICYNNSHTGVMYGLDGPDMYRLNFFGLAKVDFHKEIYDASFSHNADAAKSREFADKIAPLVTAYSLPDGFSETLNSELKNDELFRRKLICAVLSRYFPLSKISWHEVEFDLNYASKDVFSIETNLDFTQFPNFDNASLLLHLVNTLEDVQVAGECMSEISLPLINSELVRLKINDVIEKTVKSDREIDVFNHFAFSNSYALREVINNKDRSFADLLHILDKAAKYKDWLQKLEDDSNLIEEYIKKVGEKTWLESVPAKAIRFYLVTGINTVINALAPPPAGSIASIGLSAFNSFIFEKLVKKWKPNNFVQNELKPFVKRKIEE